MSNRDKLAWDIFRADNHLQMEWEAKSDWVALTTARGTSTYAHKIADAVLAAGYRKPRTITSPEELKTLEDPVTILMDYCGHPYQWGESFDGDEGWMAPHDRTPITSNHLWRFTPLTVLHEPEAGK